MQLLVAGLLVGHAEEFQEYRRRPKRIFPTMERLQHGVGRLDRLLRRVDTAVCEVLGDRRAEAVRNDEVDVRGAPLAMLLFVFGIARQVQVGGQLGQLPPHPTAAHDPDAVPIDQP